MVITGKLRKLPPESVFAAGFLMHFGIMYPGFLCYDSVNQILEARAGVYSDWHPPLMAIIWRFIDRIVPGPAGMLLLQSILVWLGAYLVFQAFFKPRGAKSAAPLLALILFLPPVFGISGAILKDVLMWGAMIAAFGIAGHIRSAKKGAPFFGALLFAATLSMLGFAVLFRHNAIFATIPILGFAIFRLYPQDSDWGLIRVGAVGACIAGLLFAGAGAMNQRLADHRTRPWVANAAFDIAGVIKRMDSRAEQQALFSRLAETLNSSGPVEPLLKAYTPMYWREVFRTQPPTLRLPDNAMGKQLHGFESLSETQLQALGQLWKEAVYSHPVLWLRHRLAVSKYVLGLVPGVTWSPVMMAQEFPSDLEIAYGGRPPPTKLQTVVETALISLIDKWFYQPWPYLILALAVLLTALRRSPIQDIDAVALASSAVFHELGLLLAAPSPDFRYSHYMIFGALLSLLLLFKSKLGGADAKACIQCP